MRVSQPQWASLITSPRVSYINMGRGLSGGGRGTRQVSVPHLPGLAPEAESNPVALRRKYGTIPKKGERQVLERGGGE